ncbi:hypothetical protein U8607_07985 [Methylobacterium durans]|uniref:hypothetical protein n=1 Tax=Methylobacterium durans TaxID=2202825 RepID=UPI002AFDD120|nr:hypothetical protein [Methylobacterium durans]MEA1832020.1 hypothetical protein [Methylobacterium durans]
MPFETNVFVNCPFDDAYLPLLRPLLFCLLDLGYEPRIALERLNSGEPRIEKIVALIRESRFGIHDLSRIQAARKGEYYRLNMPFELGLDVGCRLYGADALCSKKCLILEAERYRYQAALSDLSNSDIAVHGNEPLSVLSEVRNWLSAEENLSAPGPSAMWDRFNDFVADNYDALTERGYSDRDGERLPIPELLAGMRQWVAAHPANR